MEPRGRHSFATTRWSVVARVRQSTADADDPEARRALEELCADYWYPLYAYVRRQGRDADTAQDLVQGFFTRLLDKRDLAADGTQGRFRHYILGAMRNFMANEQRRNGAQRRGGEVMTFSMTDAEERFDGEPADQLSPEEFFDRRFALAVLDRAIAALGAEFEERGRGDVFEVLRGALSGGGATSHGKFAERLNLSESAVKVTVHRMRRRLGELLRREVTGTVADPSDVEDEIQGLFRALGGGA